MPCTFKKCEGQLALSFTYMKLKFRPVNYEPVTHSRIVPILWQTNKLHYQRTAAPWIAVLELVGRPAARVAILAPPRSRSAAVPAGDGAGAPLRPLTPAGHYT